MKKLKVIGYAWHVPHQYEISKLSFIGEYHLIHNPFKRWDEGSRPLPDHVKYVTHYDPKEKYDLAILHLDQQCVEPRISKGRLIKEVIDKIKCPIVIINHQTPFSDRMSTAEVIKETRSIVRDNPMVVNSYHSVQQWGFGYPIIHGLDVDEWHDLPKEPRAITVLTPAGMEKAYKREFLYSFMDAALEEGIPFEWVGVTRGRFNTFEEYKEFLGRSLIYLNGTMNSPMPRSRTEAMLSGCCVVTLGYHDIDKWIKNGENGFIIPRNPQSAIKLIKELLTTRYDEAIEVGQKGRETARKVFTHENFERRWIKFLNKVYPDLLK